MDTKDGKMTVIGLVDPVDVVTKLRKSSWPSAQILSISGWPEKKDDKKDGDKKEGEKKDGEKKEGDKKDAAKQVVWYPPPPPWYAAQQPVYYHHQPAQYPQYMVHSAEEDPNSCVIC